MHTAWLCNRVSEIYAKPFSWHLRCKKHWHEKANFIHRFVQVIFVYMEYANPSAWERTQFSRHGCLRIMCRSPNACSVNFIIKNNGYQSVKLIQQEVNVCAESRIAFGLWYKSKWKDVVIPCKHLDWCRVDCMTVYTGRTLSLTHLTAR